MTESVLLRLCRAQANLAETVIQPWMREHDAGARARLIESMLPRLIDLGAVLRELHAAVWKDLVGGGVREVQSLGEDLQQMWADALAFLGGVRANGRECLAQGYAIDRFDELERVVEALEQVREEHGARWPWIDQETVARSKADIAAGRCYRAKDVLDALRNPNH